MELRGPAAEGWTRRWGARVVELEEKKYIRIHAWEVSKRTYEETKYSPDPTCFAVPYGVRVRSAFSFKAGFIHVLIKSNSLSKI